jgi:hypothetical protein
MTPDPLSCPSAQPGMDGSVVFGVVGGTPERPLVSYLSEPQPVTPELLDLAGPVEPMEVFRFAAPCAESACQHFDGSRCRLAQRIVTIVPEAVRRLPPCRIRTTCRWWHEQGAAACFRCPVVVTSDHRPTPELRVAADPATPAGVAREPTVRAAEGPAPAGLPGRSNPQPSPVEMTPVPGHPGRTV